MTLSTDTVSESDPKEYLNTTLRSEATDTGLKLYFDSVVQPKTVMRLQIDTFAATGTSLTLLADTKDTASLVNKSQTLEITFGKDTDLPLTVTVIADVGKQTLRGFLTVGLFGSVVSLNFGGTMIKIF